MKAVKANKQYTIAETEKAAYLAQQIWKAIQFPLTATSKNGSPTIRKAGHAD